MSNQTITVLVPAYNMGKYLDLCLTSLLRQTYRDLIVLLIDDGSTDNGAEICDRYALLDERVQVVHSVNRGQGEARNLGLKCIQTEYVAMVDSDDCVNVHFLEYLMGAMQKTGADIVCTQYFDFAHDEEIDIGEEIPAPMEDITLYSRDEAVEQLCLHYTPPLVMPQKLYRAKVLEGIRYAEIGVNIDEWTIHRLMMNCKSFAILNKQIYYYRKSPEGMTRNFSKKKISGIGALLDRIQCVKEEGYLQYLPALYAKLHNSALLFYQRCKQNGLNGKQLLKPYKKELRKAFTVGVKHRKDLYSRKQMLLHWSFGFNFGLYDLLSKRIPED